MKRGKSIYLAWVWVIALLLVLGSAGAWGQTAKGPTAPGEAAAEEATEELKPERLKPEEVLPVPERERPGYFPTILAPTFYSIMQAGPVTGVAAPYGNAFATDTLRRGWISHGLGPVTVTPSLELDEIYRSNIFLSPTGKLSDFITLITPAIQFELPFASLHRVSVGYLGTYWIYAKHNEASHYDHNANVDTQLNFPGGLSLRVGNAFRAATEERTTVTGRERDYLRDTPYLLGTYNIGDRFKIQAGYQFDDWKYRLPVDQSNNYLENLASLNLFYKFWPKTSAILGYVFTSRTYPHSSQNNNIKNSPLVGLSWDPTAKLTWSVRFGYTFTDYTHNAPDRNNSPSGWMASLGSIYRYSRATTLNLSLQRSIQEDIDFNNRPFVATNVWVSLNHDWAFLRAATYISFAYGNSSYFDSAPAPTSVKPVTREDNAYAIGAGISRPFARWVRLRLDYSYTKRESDFSTYNYDEHRVLLGAQFTL